jgi:hypothetical protein
MLRVEIILEADILILLVDVYSIKIFSWYLVKDLFRIQFCLITFYLVLRMYLLIYFLILDQLILLYRKSTLK